MNAGRVELDLVAVGKDQVSAMLRQLESQAKKTADELKKTGSTADGAGDSLKGIGDKLGGIKEGVGPVNKLREVFENLRGNAGFVFSAIASGAALAGAAIEALTGDLFKGSAAMREWETTRGTMADGMKKTQAIAAELRAELDKLQGKTANTLDIKTDQANERLTEINRQLAVGEKATKEFRESLELMRLSPAFVFAAESFAEAQKKDAADLVSLKKQQLELNNLNLEAERERTVESLRQVAALQAYLRGDKPAANTNAADNLKVDPTLVPGYVAPGTAKPRGGGRAGSRPKGDSRTLAEILAGPTGNDDLAKALEGFDSNPVDAFIERANKQIEESSKIFEKIGGDKKNNFASALSDTELAARAAADAFDLLAASGASIESVLPGLTGAFSQISEIWKATDGSAESMAQGVLGSVDAIANAGAAWLKDEKARTRFLGAKELLLAAPLWFIDPAQAAVKTATGIGLLALGGGGGGGASGGARSSSSGSVGSVPSGGGGTGGNVIWNISTFASDPHTMQRMIAGSERATARTGIATRGAA